MIRRLLASIGIDEPVRNALQRAGVLSPTEHGHALLMSEVESLLPIPGAVATMIEVGSTREDLPGQGSTAVLADFCVRHGILFTTVDMDPENSTRAAHTVGTRDSSFVAINAKGEDFLAEYSSPVHFAYLDAFDIDHGRHSETRHRRYAEILGTSITNEACASMHLSCAVALARLLAPGGVIVLDDTWLAAGGAWEGKGTTAVPYLLDRGFSISATSSSAVALRPPGGSE